ncbi:MAG: hypothetical protein GMKNLPBB_01165 [Myxococcota bacterium]|nr:hypothetical protein [Myxococcota bacterium]
MAGIGVIINPRSRRNLKNPDRLKQFSYIVGDRGSCRETHSIEDIARVAEEFRKNDIDVLALAGGDGTNHVTLTTFLQVYRGSPLPKIALLRGGTMNTIANGCGVKKGDTHLLLAGIVEKYHANAPYETVDRDLMKIGDRMGFIFGNGLTTNFLTEYYTGAEPSPVKAFTTLSKAVGSAAVGGPLAKRLFSPVRAQVFLDGRKLPADSFSTILASTVEQIGLGFKPFFRHEERPYSFHVVAALAKPLGIVTQLPRIYRGAEPSQRVILNRVAEHMRIEFDGEMSYMIDGDMHQAHGEIEVGVGPRLTIITQ